MRDTSISILKAMAIILVVLSHAGAPSWINNFIFQFHVPVFFICTGYLFKTSNLNDTSGYLGRKVKNLYVPFLKWSLFFLIIHNFLFPLGILSEQFGNAAGGVTHPYTWQTFSQRVWSIVFNMSGYDEFLCGAFWFFRTLFLASIAYFLFYKLVANTNRDAAPVHIATTILIITTILTVWQVSMGLKVTGVAQGGYRELMGIMLISIGFIIRQNSTRPRWYWVLPLLAFLILASIYFPSSMAVRPTFGQFITLPFTAIAGFFLLKFLANHLNHTSGFIKKTIVYVGDNSLYIFAFHLLAFKIVSAIKVSALHLEWQKVGCHTVVTDGIGKDLFWLLYLLVGVALPIIWIWAYRKLKNKFGWGIHFEKLIHLESLLKAFTVFVAYMVKCIELIKKLTIDLGKGIIKGAKNFVQGIKDILNASNPENE